MHLLCKGENMDYIEKNLGQGEEIELRIKKNVLYLVPGFIILAVWIILGVLLTVMLNSISKNIIEKTLNPETPEDFMYMATLNQSDITAVEQSLKIINAVKLYSWIPISLLGSISLIKRLINFFTMSLAITNKRVVGKIGLLRIYALDIHIDKIDHVEISASFLGRLLRYYTLRVFSVGGTGMDSKRITRDDNGKFVGITNATEFKNVVNRAIELHADEARKAQAAEIAAAMSGVKH